MLISFDFTNWKSFRDDNTLSMVALRERRFSERLAMLPKKVLNKNIRILPVATIYGANASGKSNLVSALGFVKAFITQPLPLPDTAIPCQPFKLDSNRQYSPSTFSITILADDNEVYQYSFSVNLRQVVEESLVWLRSSTEVMLFERQQQDIQISKHLAIPKEAEVFLNRSLRHNGLFLTHLFVNNFGEHIKPVFNWFRETLEIILPDSTFVPMEHMLKTKPLFDKLNKLLPALDTGISKIDFEPVPLEQVMTATGQPIHNLLAMLDSSQKYAQIHDHKNRFILERTDEGWKAQRMVFIHQGAEGESVSFNFGEESDGSRRLIDLLPAITGFPWQSQPRKVIIFDEIDRSLHGLLTRKLIETFLNNCHADSRSQMIVTTHDVMLIDQALLRRDELWAVERQRDGNSELFSFAEFDIRADLDIRKYYLSGKLGGIPKIKPSYSFRSVDG